MNEVHGLSHCNTKESLQNNLFLFVVMNQIQAFSVHRVILLDCINQHFLEHRQVNFLHDEDRVLFLQLVHVVQDHHTSGVGPLQLHCHCNLKITYMNLLTMILAQMFCTLTFP